MDRVGFASFDDDVVASDEVLFGLVAGNACWDFSKPASPSSTGRQRREER
jgi:hypothetical protein